MVSKEMKFLNSENSTIIKFRKKAGDKFRNSDAALLNTLEPRQLEENIDVDLRKKVSLAGKLKTQFQLMESIRIKELNTPDKLENHVQEKFKRDKSDITKMMASLDEELSN